MNKKIVNAIQDSAFMFNAAPVYKGAATDLSKVQKRRQKERKSLQRKAQILENISEDELEMPKAQDDYGLLDQIDQDILGYFQMKGQKIITDTVKVPPITYSIDSLHLGCVCDIGPNGAYLIVNFGRNQKGFVDIHSLRNNKNVNGGDYTKGEYILAKVIDQANHKKAQLSLLPVDLPLKELNPGMAINAIPISHNEFGYTLDCGSFKGFIASDRLKLGKVYLVRIKSINLKEKLAVCEFSQGPIDQTIKNKYLFTPGNVFPCSLVKEITGGLLVRLNKVGVLGYIFQDYVNQDLKQCKIIAFDETSRQIFLSAKQEHIQGTIFQGESLGEVYDGVKIKETLFGESLLVNLFKGAQNKKQRKQQKGGDLQLGPVAMLHASHIPKDELIDDVIQKQCMIKEYNYFDHVGLATFNVTELQSLDKLQVGEIVKVTIKQVLISDKSYSLVVLIHDKFQGVIPQEQLSDYILPNPPKFRVGSKIRARIIVIDPKHNNITLTIKPTLLTEIKVFSTLDSINHGDLLYGWVYKRLENGHLIRFFQNITGFLSNQSLDGQSEEDIQVGQIIKSYVKYVNPTEEKLFLSLKKVEVMQVRKVEKQPKKSKINVGDTVQGTVTAIKNNVVYVNLPEGKFGRIHKSQFECHTAERILGVQSEFENLQIGTQISCTIQEVQKEANKQIFELSCLADPIELKRDATDAGKTVFGVVKKILPTSIAVLMVEIYYGYHIYVDGWDVPVKDGEELNNLISTIALGSPCKLILKLDTNKKLKGVIQTDAIRQIHNVEFSKQIYRVISLHESYIRVQLQNHNYASIDITEINDDWPLNPFPAIGTWGTCRIIDDNFASSRESILNDKLWNKYLHPVKSNQLAFQKMVQQPYDARNTLFKNMPLSVGQVVLGYVTGTTNYGTFVKLSYKVTCLIPGFICNIKYRPILVMITKLDKLQGTTELALLKYKLHDQVLKIGDVVDGVVINIKEKAAIKILGTLQSGELSKENADGAESEEGWQLNKLLKIGQQLKCIVVGQRQNRKGHNVIQLSNIPEIIASEAKRTIQIGQVQQDIVEMYQTLEQLVADQCQLREQIEEEFKEDEVIEEEDVPEEEEDQDQAESQQEEQIEESPAEVEIDQATLNSRAEFEKQILSNPNSSLLWIEFAAFVTEKEGVESGRSILERALRVINTTNEAERLNVFTAFLNLEFNFGSEETLIQLFKRACQQSNAKALYVKLLDIYRKAEKWDILVELARQFVQKFKQSAKAWSEYLQSLMEWQAKHDEENPQYSFQDTLHRAMQCLKKPKQVKTMAFYGRLQFQHNQIEEAKTTFETLLEKNQQRTDIWSQYIDQAIKYSSIQVVRQIFNKALLVNKKPRKMKFLFKKQLEFETMHGDEKSIAKVKEAAEKWVQSYVNSGQQELDSD